MRRSNYSLAFNLVLLALGMLALAYASVPLYRLFCEVTGYGGTPKTAQNLPTNIIARNITVQLNADIDPHLAWKFQPEKPAIEVKLGEQMLTHYVAENETNAPITGHATYNVVPFAAAPYFMKIECFCFKEQTLAAGQKVFMPVLFYLDPAMNEDPELKNVRTITLSYTFFPLKKEPE